MIEDNVISKTTSLPQVVICYYSKIFSQSTMAISGLLYEAVVGIPCCPVTAAYFKMLASIGM